MKNLSSTGIFLPESARKRLKEAARKEKGLLDSVIKSLRVEYPEAFHSDDSLSARQFALTPLTDETPRSSGNPHRIRGDDVI
ncbi:hypothetical protein [Burkholderia multivorans]|uniref:hypothetical protein n=1 Tax=Burkholderia multivorans TaxID=87883 RepID=UPI000B5A79BC|nr:hypothetical protein [Burkholderia multivorans]